jgi:MFS family permease
MFLWIFADSFPIFLASRIVGGLTEGNVQMSIAMITDLTDDLNRSKTLAWVGISFAFGFTVGPPLGAYFASIDLLKYFPGLPVNTFSSPALFAFLLIIIETLYLFLYVVK